MKKFIIKIFKFLFYFIFREYKRSINSGLELYAYNNTIKYVYNNLQEVKSVNNRLSVHDYALSKVKLNGLFLEFGVHSGKSINFLASKTSNLVYGFDSFEGLPEFWRQGFEKGHFKLNDLPYVAKNVKLIKGWFNESLPHFLKNHRNTNIAYLHIDCDLYSSTSTIFKLLKTMIIPGTIIVFDEYFNFPGWENHEYKAFQEFLLETKFNYKYLVYNELHQQVAVEILGSN